MPPLSGSYSDIANQNSPSTTTEPESVFQRVQRTMFALEADKTKRGDRRSLSAEKRKNRKALRKELFNLQTITEMVHTGLAYAMRARERRAETHKLVQELIDIVGMVGEFDNGPGSGGRAVQRVTDQRFALASVVAYLQAWREIDREAIPPELLRRLADCENIINAMQFYAHQLPHVERMRSDSTGQLTAPR